MTHLLIVSGDQLLQRMLRTPLRSQRYRATILENMDALPVALAIHHPDVILLDEIPDSNSNLLDACKRLRTWNTTPLIIASDSSDLQAKVEALDAGADDYLVKPIEPEELLARIRAMQRRLTPRLSSPIPVIRAGDLTVDFEKRTVWLNERIVDLTHKEYELLKTLILAQGQVVSYQMLFQNIGGKSTIDERSAVRAIVQRLRRKLGDDLDTSAYIRTESGLGYRFNSNLLTNAPAME